VLLSVYKKTSLFKGHRRVWLPPLGRGLPAPVQECKKGIYLDAPGSHSGLFLLPNSLLCSGSQCCKLHFHVALTPVQMKIRPLVENSDNDVIFFKLPNHNSLFRLPDAEPKKYMQDKFQKRDGWISCKRARMLRQHSGFESRHPPKIVTGRHKKRN
jgi:hypothetical protein